MRLCSRSDSWYNLRTDRGIRPLVEPGDEFELVRYLDDGRSFETTDTDRLLRFVDERRSREAASEDPNPDRIQRFGELYQAISRCAAGEKPQKRGEQ